ncbi:rhamnosyltransferase [Geomonas sp. Red276]
MSLSNFAVIVPTLNAGPEFTRFLASLESQTVQPRYKILVDSESTDSTVSQATAAGFQVVPITRSSFNHGATRQLAATYAPEAEFLVYLTQDAVLASPASLESLLACFGDDRVAAVCGRQLPYEDASPIAAHARFFNYPAISAVKAPTDITRLGIKAAFLSNSFAGYRRTALDSVGGFPADVIFGEDTVVAAKLLLNGWSLTYCAEAACYHSHNYTLVEEARRYFDIGVLHQAERWILDRFGKPEGEGKKFVLSELKYLLKNSPFTIPAAFLRTASKLVAYKLGSRWNSIPRWLVQDLSMNKGYWKK